MSCPFSDEQVAQLKAFVDICKNQPQILHHPKLSHLKDYLLSLGATLPAATFGAQTFSASGDTKTEKEAEKKATMSPEESDTESDVDLDMSGVIEPDTLLGDQIMGDPTKEPSDEDRDKADEIRSKAMKMFSEQNYDEAIKLYTEAIILNPQSALLYSKRAQVYLKMNRPNACIKDCTRTLELNCDSAAGFKYRGRAYGLLGKFEEASSDLCEALKIDYEEQTNDWLNDVLPNAEKLRQHKLRKQRKKQEKERQERLNRAREAQEARVRAAKEHAAGPQQDSETIDFNDLLFDPAFVSAFQDPELAKAFQDVSENPANFAKYKDNPKIADVILKLQHKLNKYSMPSSTGGMPPGFPGAAPAGPAKADDDVDLD